MTQAIFMSTTQTTDMTWIKDIDNISSIIGKKNRIHQDAVNRGKIHEIT